MNQAEQNDYKIQTTVPTSVGRGIRVQAAMQDKSISDYVRDILVEHAKSFDGKAKA
jgi:hypothetical protein